MHLLRDGLDEHLEAGDGHCAWHGLQDPRGCLWRQPLQDTLPRVRLHFLPCRSSTLVNTYNRYARVLCKWCANSRRMSTDHPALHGYRNTGSASA